MGFCIARGFVFCHRIEGFSSFSYGHRNNQRQAWQNTAYSAASDLHFFSRRFLQQLFSAVSPHNHFVPILFRDCSGQKSVSMYPAVYKPSPLYRHRCLFGFLKWLPCDLFHIKEWQPGWCVCSTISTTRPPSIGIFIMTHIRCWRFSSPIAFSSFRHCLNSASSLWTSSQNRFWYNHLLYSSA